MAVRNADEELRDQKFSIVHKEAWCHLPYRGKVEKTLNLRGVRQDTYWGWKLALLLIMLYALMVEHADVNITEAQSQRQILKLEQNYDSFKICMSENGKSYHVPCQRERASQGYFSNWVTTLLYCRVGWEVLLDPQVSQQPAWVQQALLVPFLLQPKPGMTQHP